MLDRHDPATACSDEYAAEGTARCPACAAAYPLGLPTVVEFAALRFRCPACAQAWTEWRQGAAAAVRYWLPRT